MRGQAEVGLFPWLWRGSAGRGAALPAAQPRASGRRQMLTVLTFGLTHTTQVAVHGKLSQLFMSCQTWKSSHLSDLAFLCDIFGSVVMI